ncbi:unnamed protein product [Allacma fusca]|uniref:RRM domain-containing protein n=1 Tax=Allacma fusca TaxID=39272 RepID=A0A8J2PAS6_9HEXA|nr:unnamed protein product [Allacma fusca]
MESPMTERLVCLRSWTGQRDSMSTTNQDFSEDITNGGFSSDAGMQNNGGDEEMTANEEAEGVMSQDDSMGATGSASGQGNGEAMDHSAESADTGSADQYGKDDDRKLFIGGLSWETTEKDLREYFTKYGGIESLTLKMDPATGRSRGFAFIVFSEVATLDKVIAAGEHVINGKKVDPKKAKARHGKIFVGGLTQEISDDDIKTYFSQFGNVVEIEMPIDKSKNQRKGFCFITFDNEQIVHELLKSPKQVISGKEVDVKKAQPPQNARGMMGPWGPMGMPMGRGARGAIRGQRGRGGRGDWTGWGGGGYGSNYGSGYGYGGYDYYGGGYGNYGYDGYGGYGGYEGYGYDGYESGPPMRGGGSSGGGGSGGRGRGGFSGKTRGAPRGQPRHMPY